MNNTKILILIGVVFVLVSAGTFFGGTQYQKSKPPNFSGGGSDSGERSENAHESGQNGFGRRFSGEDRPITGAIISKDDESITVKIQDGGSKIIFISDETTIRKTEEGSLEDLNEEDQVLVFGSQNSDGSITADNIQLNPEFGRSSLNHPGQTDFEEERQ